jgi:ABC-2 type transport system ATP-binding protein
MIHTQGLTKNYGGVTAVRPLDLEIQKGEIFGYVGPNGSGKTTTIRMLCGLLAPSGGTATVAGVDVVRNPARVRSTVGYMPDYLVPYEGMRVWEYLDFFGAAYRIRRKVRRRRIDEVLELTGAQAMRDYYVETLSHGMRQRMGVARTLIHDPDVLFLDEPTGGLDPRARVEMRMLLRRLKEIGKTILISSHILPELATICDRVGFIEQGRLVACGAVEQVQRQVHPNRVFEFEVLDRAADAEQAVTELVSDGKLSNVSRLENLIRFEMEARNDEVAALLAKLVERGYSVLGFREVVADLEEAFLALTSEAVFGQRSTEA